MQFKYNDGGRAAAGYKGEASDCVCRAISITTGLPYKQVYERLASCNKIKKGIKSANNGINVKDKNVKNYMAELGFIWQPTMLIGHGCKVHLKSEELPTGNIIASVSKHWVAVIDGVINDTHDCSRQGTRCVYGYYFKPL
jgi:hypothetical protein